MPFWVVQATEIAAGVVFADVSIHVGNPGLLVAAALAFFALAVTARGPLGIIRVCSQQLHLVLAMSVAAAVAVAPVVPVLRPDIEGIIVLEFGAVGLFRVCMLTRVAPSSPVPPEGTGRRPGPTVIDATATVAGSRPARPASGPAPASSTGPSSYDAAARWVGRTTGAAASAGKQTAARYGPSARARVKKTIRSAGRIAGAAVSPPGDRPDRNHG